MYLQQLYRINIHCACSTRNNDGCTGPDNGFQVRATHHACVPAEPKHWVTLEWNVMWLNWSPFPGRFMM